MWTVTWVLREKKNKQKTGRSSNWRNKKLHELLLVTAGEKLDICSKACSLDFFPLLLLFLCVCVSSFLVCAISMDSSKVDKCRIACSSCLSRGKKPKQNTHTHARTRTQSYNFHSLKMHWAPTSDRNVFLFFSLRFCGLFSSVCGRKQSRQMRFVRFKSLVVDLICFPHWLVGGFISQ